MADTDIDQLTIDPAGGLGGAPAPPPPPPSTTGMATGNGGATPPTPKPTQDQPYDLRSLGPLIERQQEMNRQALDAYRQQLSRPPPQIPRPQQLPPPPKSGISPQAASQWLAAAGVLGAISGLGSRRGAMAGLNAFTGTLNGLRMGNQQQYENSVKEWNQQQQQFAQNAKQEWDQYQATIERNDLTSKQAAQIVELQAMQNRNEFMAQVAREAAKRGDLSLLATTLDTSGKTMVQYFQSSREMEQGFQNRMKEIEAQGQNQVRAAEVRAGLGAESADALMQRVDSALAGNMRVATQGLRAGTQNEAAFRNLLATEAIKRGITPEMQNKLMQDYAGQLTEAQSLGRYGARSETASAEVAQAIPPVLQASDAVPRGKWIPINELMNNFKKYSSDPQYYDLNFKLQTAKNAYIRAMNPTSNATEGPRLEIRAQGLLDAATSPQALEAQLRAMYQETLLIEQGVDVARGRLPRPPDPFAGRPSPLQPQPRGGAGRMQPSQPAAAERRTYQGKTYELAPGTDRSKQENWHVVQ